MAEYNWIPFSVADEMVRLCQEMMGEPDEERWARRFADDFMDWKPSREERGWAGAYTMSLGKPPGGLRRDTDRPDHGPVGGDGEPRARAPAGAVPAHAGTGTVPAPVDLHVDPGLLRAVSDQLEAPSRAGDRAGLRGTGGRALPLGRALEEPAPGRSVLGADGAAGLAGSAVVALALEAGSSVAWPLVGALLPFPALSGIAIGYGLLERTRRRQLERLRDIQADEILYSTGQLEGKFRDLETKLEQLSLLIDLAAAVNATLDVETIYAQTLQRLVHGMGYQAAYLFLVDPARQVVRGHRMAGDVAPGARFEEVEFRLDDARSATARVATSGRPIVVEDVETTAEPLDLPTVRSLGVRSMLMVPLRVKDRVFGVLNVSSSEPGRLGEADLELLTGVANHVALAVDRAESFQTIEELSRGLEDKVRVRTEQLRTAHEELQAAYKELQATQVQLIQREKMASVGQLVAGVAHELNNPIGFVYSNVTTLEDFARRLRGMLDVYRAVALPEPERARVQAEWDTRKVDYALKYLDSMTRGIKEGAERARKIVRDLRVFARSQDDVWQSVDIHEELESSLTLLNHLLKDRVTVHKKFGEVPPVECIRSQIDQVFLNLLANAAQAIHGPGAITIETRADDGTAVLRISDTGPGIPADVIGRIFDPFFTTKPVGEGTGLGLSISYEIVKKHGGDIRAESDEGAGAAFTVRLPIARGTAR